MATRMATEYICMRLSLQATAFIFQSFNPLSIASVKSTFSPPEKMSSITRIWELFCFDLA